MHDGLDPTLHARRGGERRSRALTVALLVALALAAPAQAEDPAQAEPTKGVFTGEELATALDKTFDLLIARPLGVGRVVFGAVCFVPAAIFADLPPGLGGESKRWRASVGDVWQLFVMDQVESTFMTPLGEFEDEY